MSSLDLAKEDMTFDYRERSFRFRAYRNDGSWHSIIIENTTPLRNSLTSTDDPAKCFAQAVAFVRAAVDSATRVPLTERGIPLDVGDEGGDVPEGRSGMVALGTLG